MLNAQTFDREDLHPALVVWATMHCPECQTMQRHPVWCDDQEGNRALLHCDNDGCGAVFAAALELVPVPTVYRLQEDDRELPGQRPDTPAWNDHANCTSCGNVLLKGEGARCTPCERRAQQATRCPLVLRGDDCANCPWPECKHRSDYTPPGDQVAGGEEPSELDQLRAEVKTVDEVRQEHAASRCAKCRIVPVEMENELCAGCATAAEKRKA